MKIKSKRKSWCLAAVGCFVAALGLITPQNLYAKDDIKKTDNPFIEEKKIKTKINEGERKVLLPAINVTNKNINIAVQSILATYQILNSGRNIDFSQQIKGEIRATFIFASGEDFIIDNRITAKALTMLPSFFAEKVTSLNTKTNTCYIKEYIFSDDSNLLITVHNEDFKDDSNVFRCLILALWYFDTGSYDNVDTDSWRTLLITLFNKIKGESNNG